MGASFWIRALFQAWPRPTREVWFLLKPQAARRPGPGGAGEECSPGVWLGLKVHLHEDPDSLGGVPGWAGSLQSRAQRLDWGCSLTKTLFLTVERSVAGGQTLAPSSSLGL